uniref:hypothetical protein n=1 Tax=Candidatus Electronema sp. TaxID=2698783 RepID=UPI004055AC6F
MTTQSARQPATLELALIDVVRTLPSRRVLQVLDFARWLQTQLSPEENESSKAAQAAIEQEEKAWEQTYNANRDDFRAMARQALADLDAGETLEMVIAGGKVKAR